MVGRRHVVGVGRLGLVLGLLFAASYAAGTAGVFSSSQRDLASDLQDPATRLQATVELADRFALDIAPNHPPVAGAQSQQDCPAPWATRATSLVGALTPQQAITATDAARARFTASGWRSVHETSSRGTFTVDATNRRGVMVSVAAQEGDTAASLEITVTVPCRADRRAGRGTPTTGFEGSTTAAGA